MKPTLSRRHAFKTLAVAAATPLLGSFSSAQPREQNWKTAIGLSGFQSGSRKYKKNYPIWEVLDFASRNGFEGVELVFGHLVNHAPTAASAATKDVEASQFMNLTFCLTFAKSCAF